jgi:peptidoglycan/xylan/chitin deacetylase (PgdA/CDA1 family)
MSDVVVLCYHALSERWGAELSLPPREFERQIARLLDSGYVGTTFQRAVSSPPAERTLAVTFDDGFRSVLTLGLPVLERLGLPASVFVATAFPDSGRPLSWPGIDQWLGGPHSHELAPLSWAELGTLASAGWEIGSHSRTHPRLTELDDGRLAEELEGSRADCEERLGLSCRSLAYPYGGVDDRVAEAARRTGYVAAATLPRRLHPPALLRWPRVGVYWRDRGLRYRLKVSPTMRRLRASGLGRHLGPRERAGYDVDRAGAEVRSYGD